jgi:hypothetical protein
MKKRKDNKDICKAAFAGLLLALGCLFFICLATPLAASAGERGYGRSYPHSYDYPRSYDGPRSAPQRYYRNEYRYVAPKNGYGQRRAVPNAYEAGRIIGQYYPGQRIGPVIERDLFYQADIRDRRGMLIDKVIIDKRTGRMRSIY